MEYSPALSINSDMTDEELDKYFATYVPLSNLPTPPPAKEHAIAAMLSPASTISSTSSFPETTATPLAELRDSATHLANVVPLNVSTYRPHSDVIAGFLERANLPDEVVAFAACILDALSYRFANTWKQEIAPSEYVRDVKSFLLMDAPCTSHVSPDLIVLAALSLAHGYLSDRLRSSRHWSIKESNGAFTVQEIEATKRAILADMNYELFKISNELVQLRLRDMRKPATSLSTTAMVLAKRDRRGTLSINLSGTTIWDCGVLTPESSP